MTIVAKDHIANRAGGQLQNRDDVCARTTEDRIAATPDRNAIIAPNLRRQSGGRCQSAAGVEVRRPLIADHHIGGAAQLDDVGARPTNDDAMARTTKAGDAV